MKRYSIFLLIVFVVFTLLPLGLVSSESLSDDQLTDLLFSLHPQEDPNEGFLVLPEEYSLPVTGLDGIYHLLIVGVDQEGDQALGRSDTMVLAVLNTREGSLKLISFLRDLFVRLPGRGSNRLNAAYAFGGADLLKRTLQANFQIQVDGYVAVDFAAMIGLVDAMGGVALTVLPEEVKPLNGILGYYNYLHSIPDHQGELQAPGKQVLSGLQIMSYARIRKLDSDFGRVSRQQTVLQAIFVAMQTSKPETIAQMIFSFADMVKTDIPLLEALDLARQALGRKSYDIQTLTIPIHGAYKSVFKRDAYVLEPDLRKNTKAIQAFLQSVSPSTIAVP